MNQTSAMSGSGTREGTFNERTANFLTKLAEQARNGQLQGIAVISVEGEHGSDATKWEPRLGTYLQNGASAEKLHMLMEKARVGLVENWPSQTPNAPQFNIPGF